MASPAPQEPAPPEPRTSADEAPAASPVVGVLHGIGAYLWWGFVTSFYFRWLKDVSPWELLAWRVLGGLPVLLAMLALRGDLGSLRAALRDRPTRRALVVSTLVIAANWFCFIYAVISGRLSEASLGYYINPLISVALGVLFLRERLRPLQKLAVLLAAAGVTVLTVAQGSLPWLAIAIPISFGIYGLLRKRMAAGPTTGLCLEMLALLPAMLALEIVLAVRGSTLFLEDGEVTLGLLVGGVVTIVPLVLFASAARRLRLSTVGLLQYIAPTTQLALAVLAFGEEFTQGHAIAFAIIWSAVGVYTVDSWRSRRGT
jgi:chloramphenicol-sensitive protein RarD